MSAPVLNQQQLLATLERQNEQMRRQLAEREAMMEFLRKQTAVERKDRDDDMDDAPIAPAPASVSARKVDDLTRSFQRLNSDSDLHAAAAAEGASAAAAAHALLRRVSHPQHTQQAPATEPLEPLLQQLVQRGDERVHGLLQRQDGAGLQAYLRQRALADMEARQRAQAAELDARRRALEALVRRPASALGSAQGPQSDSLERKLQRLAMTQSGAASAMAAPPQRQNEPSAPNNNNNNSFAGTAQQQRSIVDLLNAFTEEAPGIEAPTSAAAQSLAQLQAAVQQQRALQIRLQQPPMPPARAGQTPPPMPRSGVLGSTPPPMPRAASPNGAAPAFNAGHDAMAALRRLLQQQPQQQPQQQRASAVPAAFQAPFPFPAPALPRPPGPPVASRAPAAGSLHFASAQSLGSKRERPESMQKFTQFREQNRSRTAAEEEHLLSAAPSPHGLSSGFAGSAAQAPGAAAAAAMVAAAAADAATLGRAAPGGGILDAAGRAARSGSSSSSKGSDPGSADGDAALASDSPRGAGATRPRKWTPEEDDHLRAAVALHGGSNWRAIALMVAGRTHVQCLQRWRKALAPDVVKGHWTPEEDALLLRLTLENPKNWGYVARGVPGRNPKQCRERYHNHLDPAIKKGDWTPEEDAVIVEQQRLLGNAWAKIAKHLPGRPENSVKIRWKSIQRYSGNPVPS